MWGVAEGGLFWGAMAILLCSAWAKIKHKPAPPPIPETKRRLTDTGVEMIKQSTGKALVSADCLAGKTYITSVPVSIPRDVFNSISAKLDCDQSLR